MSPFSGKPIFPHSNKIRNSSEGKLIINFARSAPKIFGFRSGKQALFDIKSETSYNSYLSDKSLVLGLKKPNCIAWTDIPELEHQDHVIEARFRLDGLGGYAAAGIIFRMMHDESYYLALVSSKGYFRLDLIKNNSPKTLIGWTEISDFNSASDTALTKKREPAEGVSFNMSIITYGTYLIFLVNNKWVGKTSDDSITSGRIGFALASYEESAEQKTISGEQDDQNMEHKKPLPAANREKPEHGEYVCKAYLEYISIDTRLRSIEDSFRKWNDDSNINAEYRLRLAETFAAMNEYSKSLEQIEKAWKRRDDTIRDVTAGYSKVRTRRELLLAARMSSRLEQYKEAEEYINMIIDQWPDSAEAKLAYTEKMRLLTELNKFKELKDFAIKHSPQIDNDADYFALLARSLWELKDYKNSADAWEKAYKMTCSKTVQQSSEPEQSAANGVYAVNAANANENAKRKKKALSLYLAAGKIFLNQDNIPELAALMPKLASLGANDWEARALIGKWAFSIEDYKKCAGEFETSEKIRLAQKKQPKPDPALYYLWGLTYHFKGSKKNAVTMIEKAVKLAPDYELFRAKLAEIKGKDKSGETKKGRAKTKKQTDSN